MANNRVSLEERESKKRDNPLFKNTSVRVNLVKRTYTLGHDVVKALDLYAAYIGKDKSEIVRDALVKTIPAKYLDDAALCLRNGEGVKE
jgi:hypothetical protein